MTEIGHSEREYCVVMQAITAPFRLVGQMFLRLGRLITGRPRS